MTSMDKIFFDSWESLVRTFIITILAYVVMVMLLRASGKRTLSKMNAFDFVVTIALGSSLATVALNKNVALADGALAFILFISLQFAISWASVRFSVVKRIVTSQPVLLLYKGELLTDTIRKERITIDEINVAARKKGIEKLSDIDFIVLETTGDITVIQGDFSSHPETLRNVEDISRQ